MIVWFRVGLFPELGGFHPGFVDKCRFCRAHVSRHSVAAPLRPLAESAVHHFFACPGLRKPVATNVAESYGGLAEMKTVLERFHAFTMEPAAPPPGIAKGLTPPPSPASRLALRACPC